MIFDSACDTASLARHVSVLEGLSLEVVVEAMASSASIASPESAAPLWCHYGASFHVARSDGSLSVEELVREGLERLHLGCGNLAALLERLCVGTDAPGTCFGGRWLHVDSDFATVPADVGGVFAVAERGRAKAAGGSGGYVLRSDALGAVKAVPTASMAAVFAEHFVEHVGAGTLVDILREVWRVLKPGGVARISTPDLAKYVVAYANESLNGVRDDWLRQTASTYAPDTARWELDQDAREYSGATVLNNIFRNYGHGDGWLWDAKSLKAACVAAGIPRDAVAFDSFRSPKLPLELRGLDQAYREPESLYLHFVKTAR